MKSLDPTKRENEHRNTHVFVLYYFMVMRLTPDITFYIVVRVNMTEKEIKKQVHKVLTVSIVGAIAVILVPVIFHIVLSYAFPL